MMGMSTASGSYRVMIPLDSLSVFNVSNVRVFAEESKYMEFHNSKSDFHLQARQSLKEMIHREQIFHWYKEFFG